LGLTSGVDALLVLFQALAPEEQDAVYARIRETHLGRLADADVEMERYVRSLRRVAGVLGRVPGTSDYRRVAKQLRKEGEDIEAFPRLYDYFGCSWQRAKEALELSGETSTRAVEARFQRRQLGKVVQYPEEVLRDSLARAVEHYGRPPTTAEYGWWREQQLALARAKGDQHPHVPTDAPFRQRWRTWEAALLHHGYTPEQVARRLERRYAVRDRYPDSYLPEGLPVAELTAEISADVELPLGREETERVRATYEGFSTRTRYVLTVRLGLGAPEQTCRRAAEPLELHPTRVRQLQVYALDALALAVEGRKTERPGLRAAITECLAMMVSPRARG
jgi:hypothetical protein